MITVSISDLHTRSFREGDEIVITGRVFDNIDLPSYMREFRTNKVHVSVKIDQMYLVDYPNTFYGIRKFMNEKCIEKLIIVINDNRVKPVFLSDIKLLHKYCGDSMVLDVTGCSEESKKSLVAEVGDEILLQDNN